VTSNSSFNSVFIHSFAFETTVGLGTVSKSGAQATATKNHTIWGTYKEVANFFEGFT
jgi:hypothetical protein